MGMKQPGRWVPEWGAGVSGTDPTYGGRRALLSHTVSAAVEGRGSDDLGLTVIRLGANVGTLRERPVSVRW